MSLDQYKRQCLAKLIGATGRLGAEADPARLEKVAELIV
jgi:hypothetical protein